MYPYYTYMANGACSQNLINALVNRRYALTQVSPPPRINTLDLSPYNTNNPTTQQKYTQFDLNMRRKAEILKYSSNVQSTQTNNLTKREKWAQIVKGNYQKFSPSLYTQSQSQTAVSTANTVCNSAVIQTPSTSCDVPGPKTYLYEDPNVILYMYQTQQDAYAIIPNTIPGPFQFKDLGLSVVPKPAYNNYFDPALFANLIVTTGIEKPFTRFTIRVPIGIRVNGKVIENLDIVQYSFAYPTNIALNVFYGESNWPNPNLMYDNITNPNSSYQLDGTFISGQTSSTITISIPDPSKEFVFDAYIGTVEFSNMLALPTTALAVYNFGFSLINLSNNVLFSPASSPVDTISYSLMVNPPDPASTVYYSENAVDLTPMPTYYPMVIQPISG